MKEDPKVLVARIPSLPFDPAPLFFVPRRIYSRLVVLVAFRSGCWVEHMEYGNSGRVRYESSGKKESRFDPSAFFFDFEIPTSNIDLSR